MAIDQFDERLNGVNAVLVAPFTNQGRINAEVATSLAQRVDSAGIHAITALGNTAEVYQLTAEERVELLRATAAGRESAFLIAGLAGACEDNLRLAETAAAFGYDAVMLHDPVDPLASAAGLAALVADLADRSPLPLILYVRTDRRSVEELIELTEHPRVIAVKYAVPDPAGAGALMAARRGADCIWICGCAESLVPAFSAVGMRGFTSGLANVRPDLALALWEATETQDATAVRAILAFVLPFELLRLRDRGRFNVAVVKTALELSGTPVGAVRPPCESLSPAARQTLVELIERWPVPSAAER